MQEDQETINLSIVTVPRKHYPAQWKFEGKFKQLKYSSEYCHYIHRNLNESIYKISIELREKATSFLQEMQESGEIEEFFFEDQSKDPLKLALIALKKSDTQNCFQSYEVVKCVIDALKAYNKA